MLSLEARERNLAARERGGQGEVEAAGLGRVEGIAELDVHGVFGLIYRVASQSPRSSLHVWRFEEQHLHVHSTATAILAAAIAVVVKAL